MQCRSRVREHSLSQLDRPAAGPVVVRLFDPDSCQAPRRGTPTTYRGVEPW